MISAQNAIARRLEDQAGWCLQLGSPLYHRLLSAAARDVERLGPAWGVLQGHEDDSGPSALALRLMGAVHRLVLSRCLPGLAQHFPSVGGVADLPGAEADFLAALETRRRELRELIERPVQTNEVGGRRHCWAAF